MDIDDLPYTASEATEPPPLPKGGIPKQWVAPWVRWPIRALIVPFVLFDLSIQKFARLLIRPPYKQGGKCKRRGNCCHYIMIRKPKGIWGWAFKIWNTQFNGFYLRSEEDYEHENHRVMVMGCRYLQKDGSCKHHTFRPMVCRKWPVIEQFGVPRMLKGCGFKAIPRNPAVDPLHILKDEDC